MRTCGKLVDVIGNTRKDVYIRAALSEKLVYRCFTPAENYRSRFIRHKSLILLQTLFWAICTRKRERKITSIYVKHINNRFYPLNVKHKSSYFFSIILILMRLKVSLSFLLVNYNSYFSVYVSPIEKKSRANRINVNLLRFKAHFARRVINSPWRTLM